MKVKKVIALLLAVTAVLSMVVSASADAGDPPIDESKFSSPVVPVEGESVILNNGLQIR